MQLVIDIPKYAYDYVMGSGYFPSNFNMISEIRNGIPLPKGHGRLIDADKLWDSYHDLDYDFYEALDSADTIIEADEESEEV